MHPQPRPLRTSLEVLLVGLLTVLLIVPLFAAVTSPAAADVLVTRTGETIQTQGPWEVDGRKILFRNPHGHLTMIRASEIDLEASEAATRHALEPEKPPTPAASTEPERSPLVELSERTKAAQDSEAVLRLDQEGLDRAAARPASPAPSAATPEERTPTISQDWSDQPLDESFDEVGAAFEEMTTAMGDAMGEAMGQAFEEMGGMLGTMLEIAADMQGEIAGIESAHDLDTAAGWQAAQPQLDALARSLDARAASYQDPTKQQAARDMARGMREAARMAGSNPEEAARRHQSGQPLVSLDG